MDKQTLATIKEFTESVLDNLEDLADESQEAHHRLVQQATGIKRTVRAIKANLQIAQRNEQST